MLKFSADVIVIAGTTDAKELIEELCHLGLKVAVTITTKFGSDLIEEHPNVQKFTRVLTAKGMSRVIDKHKALCLIDASHPYAVEVSKNAIAACKHSEIPYIRYEREEIKIADPGIKRVSSFEEAALAVSGLDGNIFLTIGSRNLAPFIKHIPDFSERLYVRVLPESTVLAQCERLGLTAANLIAVKGPFTEEFNVEMMRFCHAKVLVTKDSGIIGGTEEKITAAIGLGIKVIVIDRPKMKYPELAKTVGELLYRLGQHIEKI